jgi:hypothetical protein
MQAVFGPTARHVQERLFSIWKQSAEPISVAPAGRRERSAHLERRPQPAAEMARRRSKLRATVPPIAALEYFPPESGNENVISWVPNAIP